MQNGHNVPLEHRKLSPFRSDDSILGSQSDITSSFDEISLWEQINVVAVGVPR